MISIIVPVHNTKKYIKDCLESIIGQTYREIEIICIDSSTDETTEILKEYALLDSRIKHIIDDNSSYGYKLNLGFKKALGDYIGIVDSDDYIMPDMYQTLLQCAEQYKVDFVKSDYSSFYEENGKKIIYKYEVAAASNVFYGKVFNCEKFPEILYQNAVSIWTGLYRRDFIINNRLFLHESEGASFQDTGFCLLSHVFADKIYYLKASFYCYRTDNISSSVKSQTKNKVIAEECRWIDQTVKERGLKNKEIWEALKMKKIVAYEWNLSRLSLSAALGFADYVHKELEEQYIKSKIVGKMPGNIREKFNDIYFARQKYNEYHRKLVQRIGGNTITDENPLVSVVIPVYNVEEYLQECLLSVLEQSEKNIEVICINDGSTDRSRDILEVFASIDARIKVINQDNHGLAFTRNVAFSYIKGKYLLYIDGDDMLRQGALEELLTIAGEKETDIVCFDAECLFMPDVKFDEAKDRYYKRKTSYGLGTGKELFARMYTRERFTDSACLMFIKREWLLDQKIYFYNGILYEDSIFSIQCMIKAQRVFHINQKYYVYRIRSGSIMTTNPFRAENLYSRAIGLQHLLKIYREEELTDFQQEAFCKWIKSIVDAICHIGRKITRDELNRFYFMPEAKKLKLELELGNISWNRICERVEIQNVFERFGKEKNIVIYGAGIRGKRLLEYFSLLDNAVRVKCFVVTSQKSSPDKIRGVRVESLEQGYVLEREDFIIISFKGEEGLSLKDELERKGYKKVMVLDDTLNAEICEWIREELKI